MEPEVCYLGHRLSSQGIHPLQDKVKAIQEFHVPRDKSELSTFCGMVKYYHRFLPRVSAIMSPLFALEKKENEWSWGKLENDAFLKAKELLKSNTLLVHYDVTKPLILTCDARSFGLGAALEQEYDGGILKPVCFASRTLGKAEKNYSQTEKEGLAVVWAVAKFSKYLYGRKFEIRTDHKPLLGLIGENKPVPMMASGRIIRWCLQLAAYDYTLVYRKGSSIANADCLSRFPMKTEEVEPPSVGEEIMLLDHLASSGVNADDIRRWTEILCSPTCVLVCYRAGNLSVRNSNHIISEGMNCLCSINV